MDCWYAQISLEELKKIAISGNLRNRIVTWRVLLGLFSGTIDEWIAQSWKMREEYYKLKAELSPSVDQTDEDLNLHNPLSTYHKNPWMCHFKNSDIRSKIKLDVYRTMPENEIFRRDHIQKVLEDVLFVWSALHDIGYQQGYNEIIAIIIIVGLEEEETIDGLSSWEHLEADTYWIFDKIMSLGVSQLYKTVDESTFENSLNDIPRLDKSKFEDVPELVRKSHYIFHRILQKIEPKLHAHILKHEFEPQIILVRWLRCLFSREFSVYDTVMIWDAIFGIHDIDMPDLELVNYICAVMLDVESENRNFYLVLKVNDVELLKALTCDFKIENSRDVIDSACVLYNSKPRNKSLAPVKIEEQDQNQASFSFKNFFGSILPSFGFVCNEEQEDFTTYITMKTMKSQNLITEFSP